jgi:hypothetical protein
MASNRSIDPARPFEQYRTPEKCDEPGAPLTPSNNKKRPDPFMSEVDVSELEIDAGEKAA